jgi:hypothetical protein
MTKEQTYKEIEEFKQFIITSDCEAVFAKKTIEKMQTPKVILNPYTKTMPKKGCESLGLNFEDIIKVYHNNDS